MSKWVTCPTCKGTGKEPCTYHREAQKYLTSIGAADGLGIPRLADCPGCHGTGYTNTPCYKCSGRGGANLPDCPRCNGSGSDPTGGTCRKCAGKGWIYKDQ